MTIAALVAGGSLRMGTVVAAFLAVTPILPAHPDPRCNTAARYEAVAEGADCFNPPKWPRFITRRHKDRK